MTNARSLSFLRLLDAEYLAISYVLRFLKAPVLVETIMLLLDIVGGLQQVYCKACRNDITMNFAKRGQHNEDIPLCSYKNFIFHKHIPFYIRIHICPHLPPHPRPRLRPYPHPYLSTSPSISASTSPSISASLSTSRYLTPGELPR